MADSLQAYTILDPVPPSRPNDRRHHEFVFPVHERFDAPAKAGGGGVEIRPWDVFEMVGVGTPDDDGIYASYACRVWPGSVSGVMASNIMAQITVSKNLTYWKAACTTNGTKITSVGIDADTSPPVGQTPESNVAPLAFEVPFAVTLDGKAYRTIGSGSITAVPKLAFALDKAAPPAPGMPSQDFWYLWEVVA